LITTETVPIHLASSLKNSATARLGPLVERGSFRSDALICGPSNQDEDLLDDSMKTQGEIEAAICEGITRFEQEYMGRGPKNIHTHVIGDLVIVRLRGVLTAAEQQLAKALAAEKGRDLLKQVRTHLIETARPVMEAMIQNVIGVKVVSLHHDISTATGEEIVIFTMESAPSFRETKKQHGV
jgi:uncharacterized protein YbcI